MGLSAGIGEVVRGARDGSGDGSTPYDPIGGGDGAATVSSAIELCLFAHNSLHEFSLEKQKNIGYCFSKFVQVMIRIRPINKVESALHGYNRCLIQESSQTLTWTGHPETRFTFDHVACEDTTQAIMISRGKRGK
uniref:Kinesin motor domain-containing protein n=1 Tax=Ananas comosus var. bracteatus TaxID=296719 RepID=A0A6V7PLC3_ANACO|nr:unnamed protein product [Ananas comosus var. bracteatus]